MASDLNQLALVCRLTRDPELRSLPSGTNVADLRVAFSTSKKTPSGQWEDESNFIDVSVFGPQGEAVAKLTKGQRIGISGRIQHRTWQDKNGNSRERHSIVASTVQYLDPKVDRGSSASAPATRPASAPAVADEDVPF